jgi:hypothetical protein
MKVVFSDFDSSLLKTNKLNKPSQSNQRFDFPACQPARLIACQLILTVKKKMKLFISHDTIIKEG